MVWDLGYQNFQAKVMCILFWFLWLQFAAAISLMWIALNLQELDNCKVLLAFYHFLLFLFRDASCLWRVIVLG
jgi:hypothetical protein